MLSRVYPCARAQKGKIMSSNLNARTKHGDDEKRPISRLPNDLAAFLGGHDDKE